MILIMVLQGIQDNEIVFVSSLLFPLFCPLIGLLIFIYIPDVIVVQKTSTLDRMLKFSKRSLLLDLPSFTSHTSQIHNIGFYR